MLENKSVIYTVKNRIAYIELNEPLLRNALSDEVKVGLLDSFELAENASNVSAVILSGRGKGFCSGGDIKGMGNRTALESVEKMSNTSRIALRMESFKKPIIASVHGYAVGAGMSLALASDIIFAEEETKFALSFNKVGLIPDCGALYYLPRIIGQWKAKELIFSGDSLTSEKAEQLGIVNKVFPKGAVLTESVRFAEKIAKEPLQTMSFVKSIMAKTSNSTLAATMEYENYAQGILQQSDDHLEGITAFKEKRKPVFMGK